MADKTDTRLAGLTEDDVDLHPSKLCKPWCDSMCIPPLSIVSFRKVRFFFFFFFHPRRARLLATGTSGPRR